MESLKNCNFVCKALPCWHPVFLDTQGKWANSRIPVHAQINWFIQYETCLTLSLPLSDLFRKHISDSALAEDSKAPQTCQVSFQKISIPPPRGWSFRLDPHQLLEFPYVLYNAPKPLESLVTLKIMNCLPSINHCSYLQTPFDYGWCIFYVLKGNISDVRKHAWWDKNWHHFIENFHNNLQVESFIYVILHHCTYLNWKRIYF